MNYQDITIVITSFKSEKMIASCLMSIGKNIKVLVIENSNNSELKEQLEQNYPNLKCILSDKNLGYAKGNNLGLSLVKTKYALIMNPDAELQKDTIKNFFKTADKYSDFAIIGPLIQEGQKKNIVETQITKNIIEVENVKGFAMFMNLKEFRETGFFDENFFIYFEEIDLCKRLRKQNKKIYLDSTVKIFHSGGSSHDEKINFEMEKSRNWHWMWSSFHFNKKHYGFFFALVKSIPKLLSSIIKILIFTIIFNKEKKSIYYCRFSGILNSILMRKSWYRPKVN